MLGNVIVFVPVVDAERARDFYTGVLGLEFVSDDGFAVVCRNVASGCRTMLRLVRMQQHTPVPFTIAGWETGQIDSEVVRLAQSGVSFLRYDFLQQDEHGIWSAPDGDRIAWFKDTEGNTLSLSQHSAA